MPISTFLIINTGSSGIKFSIIEAKSLQCLFYGNSSLLERDTEFLVKNSRHEIICQETFKSNEYAPSLQPILQWLDTTVNLNIIGIGHRMVHGGDKYITPSILTPLLIDELAQLIPLAPLHQSNQIDAINALLRLKPDVKQIACFDTAFHCTQTELSKHYGIPDNLTKIPIIRYGFHGISYQYIASAALKYLTPMEQNKVIVAHLGNGASLCAMKNLQSVSTTMGFTPLDGLMMGTRCGSIDPGIICYLMREMDLNANEIQNLLYNDCGLKGVSGISQDMKILLESNEPSAKFAVELFCYQAAKQLAGLIPSLDGLNAIIFTAGIGENSPEIRNRICQYFSWLDMRLDDVANKAGHIKISAIDSAISVYAIPTSEEYMIAKLIQPFFTSKHENEPG